MFESSIDLIISLQAQFQALNGLMKLMTFLGTEDFYFLVMPALYWVIDPRLGVRIAFYTMTSVFLNANLKMVLHSPRPYWVDPRVKMLASADPYFGLPSGHSQNAVAVWGGIASALKHRFAWIGAVVLIFLIGMSRLLLGVHFPGDILLGWTVGIGLLVLLLVLERPVLGMFMKWSLRTQVGVVFALSLAMIGGLVVSRAVVVRNFTLPGAWATNALLADPETPIAPFSMGDGITTAATFFGLFGGFLLFNKDGWLDAGGSWIQRGLRILVGVVGVLIFWQGLDQLFALLAPDETILGYVLRYVRYSLVGVWISALGPLVFLRLGLVKRRPE